MSHSFRILGAQQFNDTIQLYGEQRKCAEELLAKIFNLGHERHRNRTLPAERPHQIFIIDADRGAGKTTLLLTLRNLLTHMEFGGKHSHPGTTNAKLSDEEKANECEIRACLQRLLSVTPGTNGHAMHCLPTIFPDHLESNESVMEALIARIDMALEEKQQSSKQDAARWKKLQKQLREKVYAGWAFSNDHGVEAILRDSMNYEDYAALRAKFSGVSANRQNEWRHFVNQWLDAINVPLLGIFFDDSDLAPQHGWQVFDTIRTYLNHPRIVTFVALDFPVWENRLQRTAIKRILPFVRSVRHIDEPWVREQIELERQDTRAHLSKALPVSHRYRFGLKTWADIAILWGDDDSFTDYCAKQFYSHKHDTTLALSWWWLVQGDYPRLPFDNVRWATEFLTRIKDNHAFGDVLAFLVKFWNAQAIETLFSNRQGIGIRQACTELLTAIQSGKISVQVGELTLTQNGRGTPLSAYEERLVTYLIDIAIAENPSQLGALHNLMPPEVAAPRSGIEAHAAAHLGIASRYSAELPIPRNLLYFSDLATLNVPANGFATPSLSADSLWFSVGEKSDFWPSTPLKFSDVAEDYFADVLDRDTASKRIGVLAMRFSRCLDRPSEKKTRSSLARSKDALALEVFGALVRDTPEADFLYPLLDQLAPQNHAVALQSTRKQAWDWGIVNQYAWRQQQEIAYALTLAQHALQIARPPEIAASILGNHFALNPRSPDAWVKNITGFLLEVRDKGPTATLNTRKNALFAWAILQVLPTLIRESLKPNTRLAIDAQAAAWRDMLRKWGETLNDLDQATQAINPKEKSATDKDLPPFADMNIAQRQQIFKECEQALTKARELIEEIDGMLTRFNDADIHRLFLACQISKLAMGWVIDLADHLKENLPPLPPPTKTSKRIVARK